MSCSAPPQLSSKRVQIALVYLLTARRYGIQDVRMRAQRVIDKMKISPAMIAPCSLTAWGKKFYSQKAVAWVGKHGGFRTYFRS